MTSPRSVAVVAIASLLSAAGCGGSSSSASTYAISGAVSGAISEGVTMTLAQNGATVATETTPAGGGFKFTGLASGSYILTPTLAGYTFAPASVSVTVNGADVTGQNFTAASAAAAPAAPTGVTATPGDGKVTVSWSAVAGAATYTIYRSTTSGAGKAGTPVPGIGATTTEIPALANGTTYYFVVTATNSAGESPVSSEVSATPAAAGGTVTVGGTLSGLATTICNYPSGGTSCVPAGQSGVGVSLQNNGGDALALSADGPFTFSTPVAQGGTYAVAVSTQPGTTSSAPNGVQLCTVSSGSGTASGNVSDVAVSCVSIWGGPCSTVDGSTNTTECSADYPVCQNQSQVQGNRCTKHCTVDTDCGPPGTLQPISGVAAVCTPSKHTCRF